MSAFDQDYDFSSPLSSDTDDELESRWDDADSLGPGFERFYREHYAFVWRGARRLLAGAGDDQIEDVIQETWIAAYRRFDSYTGACRPTTWLFGILRNVVRNHARGERRHNRRVAALVDHERERERQREASQSGEPVRLLGPRLLEGFLRTLDEDKRAVFVLAEFEGHSGREIAEALRINANTVHSRLRAARQQFCTYFELPREQLDMRTRPLRERPEQPPAQALARSRALLLVGLGKSPWVASSTGLGVAMLAKVATAIAAVVVAGVGLFAVERMREDEPPIAVTNEVEPLRGRGRDRVEAAIGEPGGLEQLVEEIIEEPIEEPAPIPVSAPAVRRSKPQQLNVYELLRQARKHVVDDQPAQALELLAKIPASNSTARGERVVTEVAALCRLNRGNEARVVVERFAKVEPNSPLLARLDSSCW